MAHLGPLSNGLLFNSLLSLKISQLNNGPDLKDRIPDDASLIIIGPDIQTFTR